MSVYCLDFYSTLLRIEFFSVFVLTSLNHVGVGSSVFLPLPQIPRTVMRHWNIFGTCCALYLKRTNDCSCVSLPPVLVLQCLVFATCNLRSPYRSPTSWIVSPLLVLVWICFGFRIYAIRTYSESVFFTPYTRTPGSSIARAKILNGCYFSDYHHCWLRPPVSPGFERESVYRLLDECFVYPPAPYNSPIWDVSLLFPRWFWNIPSPTIYACI